MFAFEVVRRFALPNIKDVADGFGKHLVAINATDAKRFSVRFQRARADAENETAFEQVIHHGCLRGGQDRVCMR